MKLGDLLDGIIPGTARVGDGDGMRLKIKRLTNGPGPNETVIEVRTSAGSTEEVVVHGATIQDDTIEVGLPIHTADGDMLVELPREAMSGLWRVWVSSSEVAEASK